MKKRKHDIFDIKPDEEEQEISNAVDKAIDRSEVKSVDGKNMQYPTCAISHLCYNISIKW